MSTASVLFELAWRFAGMSLLAIGGANTVLPEMHRVVVEVEHWMTSAQFAELFALAQLAPGPNAMIVALVGWKVAGNAGAFVATLAICGPSSLLSYVALHWWQRLRHSPWRTIIARGLAPVAIGLVLASGYTLARGADRGVMTVALTAVAGAALAFTRLNPVWVLALAASVGVAGWG